MMLTDPMSFSAVMLNVYSAPAIRLETLTDVVLALLTEIGFRLLYVKIEPGIEHM